MPITPPHRNAPRRTTSRATTARTIAVMVGAAMLLAGCITGERPTLDPVAETDDPAAATVIERLERADSISFTATYDITPTSSAKPTQAIVRQLDGRRRVTVGDVDYVTDGGQSTTCLRATGECFDFLDDARISDLGITNRFWSEGFATRLTIDAARRVGFSEGATETIVGRPAVCAEVPVLGGNKLYCALDEGVLARYFGADVAIELTSYSNDVDPAVLSRDADPQL